MANFIPFLQSPTRHDEQSPWDGFEPSILGSQLGVPRDVRLMWTNKQSLWIIRGIVLNNRLQTGKKIRFSYCRRSVSYTHLDVYKRQTYMCVYVTLQLAIVRTGICYEALSSIFFSPVHFWQIIKAETLWNFFL